MVEIAAVACGRLAMTDKIVSHKKRSDQRERVSDGRPRRVCACGTHRGESEISR